VADLNLPDGYMLNKNGIICYIKEGAVNDAGKMTPQKEVPLFACKVIGTPWAEKGHRGHMLHFTVTADLGYTEDIAVPLTATHSTTALCLCLTEQGCKIEYRSKEFLCDFMTHWLGKLHDAAEALHAIPFGWWMNKSHRSGFAYGGRIVKNDSTISKSGDPGSPALKTYYQPTGAIEPWFKALKLITDQHRPAVEVLAAAAFASPLIAISGQYAGCLCGFSESGGNKSTAVKIGLSVWGHPRHTKQVSDSSHKALLKTMGDIRNLPSYSDDISDPDIMETTVNTIMSATQGVGGAKLFTSRKLQAREEWDSLMIIASNNSMFDIMAGKIKDNTAGVNRIFEFEVPEATADTPGRMESWEAEPILQQLEENFGRMGERYASLLGSDPKGVEDVVLKITAHIGKEVGARGEERFWMAIAPSVLAGARLANECGASFNIEEIHEFLVQTYLGMRERVQQAFLKGTSIENTTLALTSFIVEYSNRALRTEDMPVTKRGHPKKLTELSGPRDFHQSRVHMHWVTNDRMLRISKEQFLKFLKETKRSPTQVLSGLAKFYGMAMPMPVVNMCAGTTYQGGPEPLIVLPVPPGSWLEDGLYARTPVDQMLATQQGLSTGLAGLSPTGAAPPAPSPGP
jgi:hypothetical protein